MQNENLFVVKTRFQLVFGRAGASPVDWIERWS
jgi:hypothetical protein